MSEATEYRAAMREVQAECDEADCKCQRYRDALQIAIGRFDMAAQEARSTAPTMAAHLRTDAAYIRGLMVRAEMGQEEAWASS